MASNSIDTTQNTRLSEKEKHVLIGFYKENEALLDSESSFRNKEEKLDLVKLFDGKYEEKILEKTFHSLRVGFARELPKTQEQKSKEEMEALLLRLFFKLLICFKQYIPRGHLKQMNKKS